MPCSRRDREQSPEQFSIDDEAMAVVADVGRKAPAGARSPTGWAAPAPDEAWPAAQAVLWLRAIRVSARRLHA